MYSNLMPYVPNRKPPMGAVLNPYLPINRGIASYWPMWSGAGNKVSDLSGNGNHGTLQGTAPSWTAGKFGSAVLLPGTDEYIIIDNESNFDIVDALTISMRVYPKSGIEQQWLISKRGANDFYASFIIRLFNDTLTAQMGNLANDGSSVSISSIITLDSWHHILFTHNSVTAYLYVDGVLVDSDSIIGGIPTNNHQVTIGARSSPAKDKNVNCLIDHVSIYNRHSSASEIALFYRELFCGFRWPNIIELAAWVSIGENFVRTISDTVGLIDTESFIKEIYRTFDESMGVVDAKSKIWDSIRIVAESLGIADTFSKEEAKIISESLGINDVASKVSIVLKTLVENLGLTDAIALQRFMTVDDALGITDDVALRRVITIADTLGITDDVVRLVNYLRTKTDDMGLLDSMVRVSLVLRTIDDDIGVTDEASAQLGALLKAVWAFVIMRQTHS